MRPPERRSASVRQESFNAASMITEQVPQVPCGQSPLTEISPSLSRGAPSSVVPLSTNSAASLPLSANRIAILGMLLPRSPGEQPAEMDRKHSAPIPGAGDGIRRRRGVGGRGSERRCDSSARFTSSWAARCATVKQGRDWVVTQFEIDAEVKHACAVH